MIDSRSRRPSASAALAASAAFSGRSSNAPRKAGFCFIRAWIKAPLAPSDGELLKLIFDVAQSSPLTPAEASTLASRAYLLEKWELYDRGFSAKSVRVR